MLKDIEPIAIEWGVPADKFWSMSYSEIIAQVEANKKRYELEMKNEAMFRYNSATLNAYALNDPSKMPKIEEIFPFMKTEEQQVPISEQPYDMEEDRAIFMRAAMGVQQHLRKVGETDGTGETGDNH